MRESTKRILKPIKFDVMVRNELCVSVEIDRINKKLNLEVFTDEKVNNPFRMPEPKIIDAMEFIESRCFPETRGNCKELLERLGLDYYSPTAITKITRGLMMDDYMWIRYEGDEATYEEIKIREG